MQEIIEIIKLLWSGDHITYKGKHFNIDNISLGFRPYQRPTIPIRLATHSGSGREKQYLRTAQISDGIISISDSPNDFRDVISRVKEEAKKINRDIQHFHNVYYLTVNINDNNDAAIKESDDWIKKYYGLNFWTEKWGPFGSTTAIKEKIIQYYESGADEVIVRFASYDQTRQFEQFERSILPEFL
jgi:alkanesulfonate monooxygenase SsuD/methylene tetrahydromethanopterin reductase-like flavin-dependent oxidoreductase (luciferase family)